MSSLTDDKHSYHQPENLWNGTVHRKYHPKTKKEMENKVVTL
jgi:hypothetical protein